MQAAMAQVVAHLIGSEEVTSSTLVSSFLNHNLELKRHDKKALTVVSAFFMLKANYIKNANIFH